MRKKLLCCISLLLSVLLLCSCGTDAGGEPLKVGLLGTSVKPVGVLLADKLGYFEEEGVEVEFQKVSGMNDAYAALARGALDVYLFSSTAAAAFISQGTESIRVMGGTASEGSEIMGPKGCPAIKSPDDLCGKTIACQMPETGQMVLKNYLIQNGYSIGAPGEGKDVSFIYVNDSSAAIMGCVKGEYDLCITNACLGYYAKDYGAELAGSVKQFVNNYPCCRQSCCLNTYEKHFDTLKSFEVALLRGYRFYLENPEETLDMMVEYSGEDREFLRAQLYGTDNYSPVMRLFPDPDRRACAEFYEAMENIGEIKPEKDIDWNEYIVTDVYSSALKELISRDSREPLWRELEAYFAEHN
ncbi:MAG: ABC transporter substrate-binding protein [Candidatus Limivicinus sp.]